MMDFYIIPISIDSGRLRNKTNRNYFNYNDVNATIDSLNAGLGVVAELENKTKIENEENDMNITNVSNTTGNLSMGNFTRQDNLSMIEANQAGNNSLFSNSNNITNSTNSSSDGNLSNSTNNQTEITKSIETNNKTSNNPNSQIQAKKVNNNDETRRQLQSLTPHPLKCHNKSEFTQNFMNGRQMIDEPQIVVFTYDVVFEVCH